MKPKILTFDELMRVLGPKTHGWPWAIDAIHDLWKTGAPVPNQHRGQPERRIISPGQFAKWWGEVQQRMGIETPFEEAFGDKAKIRR